MRSNISKIVFIGAGKVATALGLAFAGKREIVQVYSKSNTTARKQGSVLKCPCTNDLKKINTGADIYIIAVKDDVIEKIASKLRLKGKIVVHTSGSVEMKVLKKISDNYGVFYPLQTFSKDSKLKNGIPFCIEASTPEVYKQLETLVKELKGKVYNINSSQRAKLHLAAVFANNFTNYLYAVAYNILNGADIPFDVLLPLIHETVNKLQDGNPAKNQTGPAIRNDVKTIKKHRKMLKDNPQYLKLYKLLTQSIRLNKNAKEL
ncbi:MAG: Rossmann-like and DUF2520 domain-containing protein [Bacteroidia bacterium]